MCFVDPTILIGLYDGLIALFPSFWVGQDHFQADVGVRWQVSHQVPWCCGGKTLNVKQKPTQNMVCS